MSTDDDLNRLSTMPADEALLELAKREPRLLLLAEDVRLGNLGNMPDPEYLSELTRSMSDLSPLRKKFARGQAAREIAALWRGVATVEENLERRVSRSSDQMRTPPTRFSSRLWSTTSSPATCARCCHGRPTRSPSFLAEANVHPSPPNPEMVKARSSALVRLIALPWRW